MTSSATKHTKRDRPERRSPICTGRAPRGVAVVALPLVPARPATRASRERSANSSQGQLHDRNQPRCDTPHQSSLRSCDWPTSNANAIAFHCGIFRNTFQSPDMVCVEYAHSLRQRAERVRTGAVLRRLTTRRFSRFSRANENCPPNAGVTYNPSAFRTERTHYGPSAEHIATQPTA
jgi:hypothetical protein